MNAVRKEIMGGGKEWLTMLGLLAAGGRWEWE
jgi:hypothetical protein